MSVNYVGYGMQVARAWLQTGWPADLDALVADMNSDNRQRREAGDLAVLGALVAIQGALAAAKAAGVRITSPVPTADQVVYERSRGPVGYSRLAQGLIDAAKAMRRDNPQIQISWPVGSGKAQAEQATNGPLEVRIIGMPSRETTTAITRDGKDNIASTKQVESDIV